MHHETSEPAEHHEPQSATQAASASKLVLIFVLVYVAMNLRPALLSVGPMADSMRSGLTLSAAAFGVLITLPVLCFGLFAPFAPRLLRFQSAERLILLNLMVLLLGIALRSTFGVVGLFGGTLIIGLSISVVMVLLPSIIKQHFPKQAGMMMGLYSTALALGAAIAAGATVPLEQWLGSWRLALGFWFIPAVVAVVVWWRHAPAAASEKSRESVTIPRLRRNWLAWQVTIYMGLQGAIAYSLFGWLPLILIDRGLSALDAGLMLAITMFVQLSTSLAGPWMATRGRDQRSSIFVMLALVLAGWIGFIYGDIDLVYVWATIFGLGFGGMFSIAMALLVLRSPNPAVAASLSGMSQGVGYTMAAVAPLVVGVLHDLTGNWNAVSVFMILLILGALWSGLLAGRSRYIDVDSTDPQP